jgi:hypothetical protein
MQTLRMKRASGIELHQPDRALGIQWWLSGQQRTVRVVASAAPRVAVQVVESILDALDAHADARAGRQPPQHAGDMRVRAIEHDHVGEFGLPDHHLGLVTSVVEFGVAERLAQPHRWIDTGHHRGDRHV